MESRSKKPIRVLSLFDGISCGQLALTRAGIEVEKYFASEIDEKSKIITQKNFPQTIQLGDVCKLKPEDIGEIDLLIGGSPCQSFSNANGHNRNGLEGKSKLFWEFARLLRELKPTFFLLENVVMKDKWASVITKEMGVNPIFIDSSDFSAQTRKRLYWTNIPVLNWKPKNIFFESVLSHWDGPWLKLNENQLNKLSKINPSISKSNALTQAQSRKGSSQEYLTMLAKIKKIQKNDGYRAITSNECELLQTLPLNYTRAEGVSETHRMNAIGNGWTVDVISHIFKGMFSEKSNQIEDVLFII